ncbi:hypothetical protein IL54_1761 [Sphingobium sp. ba1]|nr:hypothetical protein IL54_1761 [Sphingobium sp. ba1]
MNKGSQGRIDDAPLSCIWPFLSA